MKFKTEVDTRDIKRCYVYNEDIKYPCPCGNEIELYDDFYFSYPRAGEETSIYFYCNKCDSEYEVPTTIIGTHMEIEMDFENTEKA